MKYGWRSFAFDLPEGLEDETVLTFLSLRGDTVAFNVQLSRAPLGGPLDAYVAEALDDVRRSLSAYQLLGQRTRKVGGLDAHVIEQAATSPDGETLYQRQAYVANGKEVLVVTATGRDTERDALGKAFEHILDTFRAT